MNVLVSDTSVLLDLERGALLEASFRLPFRFTVPDLLYERELKDWRGAELIRLGLAVEELDGDGVSRALAYRQRAQALSLPDCFALALAQTRSWTLLSGDSALRRGSRKMRGSNATAFCGFSTRCTPAAAVSVREVHDGLTKISKHPRCRLPKPEIRRRLARYADILR